MAKLTTYISSGDARAQAEFYTNALGGEIHSVMTYGDHGDAPEELKDKVLHLNMTAAGVTFLMSDHSHEPLQPGNAIHINLEFATEEEAHDAFAKLGEGGQVTQPLIPAFWGALFGIVVDKYGIPWMITTEPKQPQE
ncbi:hypothetical protein CIG75_17810 [Tumebacillus algifaecis]|uniref:Glyoxalase/fosfomycin resistance/dioxygenase domain-containing protein n=1 Tax=Tumebacillus algifaecis TaxID=1214604 RepID=A0A223D4Z1_9BACL|nr:VOC family protein [Tumebacillus algifaecis]ASS76641.1 hypothetical protein CIG75_17810 [Tumebacillus algifaecis]